MICEELGRHETKIQEVSEDITSWKKFVLTDKTSLEEEITQKDEEKGKKTLKVEATQTGCVAMHLRCVKSSIFPSGLRCCHAH